MNRRVVGTVLLAVSLVACSEGTDLGAVNRCDVTIEVVLSGSQAGSWRGVDTYAPGEFGYNGTVGKDPERVFAFVRSVGDDEVPLAVLVDMASIDKAFDAEGIEWLVPIEGDLCPDS